LIAFQPKQYVDFFFLLTLSMHYKHIYLCLFLSMFGSVELDNLNPRMVSHVYIKVVYNLEGPFV